MEYQVLKYLLEKHEEEIPELLEDLTQWKSKLVDYEKPIVHRLYRQFESHFGAYRIYLHRFLPMGENENAFYHPHPWPAIVKIIQGGYLMDVGYGPNGQEDPPKAIKLEMAAGSIYSMEHDSWHSVKPLKETYSIMVTGPVWDYPWSCQHCVSSESKTQVKSLPLAPLPQDKLEELVNYFKKSDSLFPKLTKEEINLNKLRFNLLAIRERDENRGLSNDEFNNPQKYLKEYSD